MADDRVGRIESKLDKEVEASATFRGELRQFMASSDSYLRAVSIKAGETRVALDDHEKDPDAHGAGVRREIDGKIATWATIGATFMASCGGVIGWLAHKLGSKP